MKPKPPPPFDVRHCTRCGDPLPAAAPSGATTCRVYADWFARQRGDMLTGEEWNLLSFHRKLCDRLAVSGGKEQIDEP